MELVLPEYAGRFSVDRYRARRVAGARRDRISARDPNQISAGCRAEFGSTLSAGNGGHGWNHFRSGQGHKAAFAQVEIGAAAGHLEFETPHHVG